MVDLELDADRITAALLRSEQRRVHRRGRGVAEGSDGRALALQQRPPSRSSRDLLHGGVVARHLARAVRPRGVRIGSAVRLRADLVKAPPVIVGEALHGAAVNDIGDGPGHGSIA